MAGLDQLDERIVAHLREDGRRSFRRIARDLGVSEATVRARVTQLVADGAIRITINTNVFELGYLTAELRLDVGHEHLEDVLDRLSGLPQVDYAIVCTGRPNLSVAVVCSSLDQLERLVTRDIAGIPGVATVDARLTLDVVKDLLDW